MQSRVGFRAAVRRAVVDHPEDAPRRAVRLLRHDVFDETVKRRDAGSWLAPSKHPGSMHVPGGQVGPGPVPPILVLDPLRLAGRHRRGGMAALPRLNTGLFISRDHVVARSQRPPVPATRVEIQDRIGALGKARILISCSNQWTTGSQAPGALTAACVPLVEQWQAAGLCDPAEHPRWIAAVLLGLVSSLPLTVGADAGQTESLASRIVVLLQRAFPPAAPSG